MAYNKDKLIKEALKAIEEHGLVFFTDVVKYLPISEGGAYKKRLHEHPDIKQAMHLFSKSRIDSLSLDKEKKNNGEGYVYLVKCDGFDYYKIGISKVGVAHRLSNIQSGCPFDLHVLHTGYSPRYRRIESLLHNKYRKHNKRGEWFEFSKKLVSKVISDIDKLCLDNSSVNINVNVVFKEQAKLF